MNSSADDVLKQVQAYKQYLGHMLAMVDKEIERQQDIINAYILLKQQPQSRYGSSSILESIRRHTNLVSLSSEEPYRLLCMVNAVPQIPYFMNDRGATVVCASDRRMEVVDSVVWNVNNERHLDAIVSNYLNDNIDIQHIPWSDASASMHNERLTADACRDNYNARHVPKWTNAEDDVLISVVSELGTSDWSMISRIYNTRTPADHRPPWQCYSRYRSVLVPHEAQEWTDDDDDKLKSLVERFGDSWTAISAFLPGRTPEQCLHRYKRIRPDLKRGHWSVNEDIRMLLARKAYGECEWSKIAEHVPGRSDRQVQDRANAYDISSEIL